MERIIKLISNTFPSDPATGQFGSITYTIRLAQIAGVPMVGMEKQTFAERSAMLLYGFFMVVIMVACYTGFEIYDLILSVNDFDAFTQNFCLSLAHFAGILKVLNTLYYLNDIKAILEKLKFISQKYVVSEKQHEAFFASEVENKVILTIYATIIGFTATFAMILLFFNAEAMAGKVFPYHVHLPDWLPHMVQLFYMGLTDIFSALQIVPMDYLNINLMNQIRSQLKILNIAFSELHHDLKIGAGRDIAVPNERLKSIVQHHCILLELRNRVEEIYSIPVLLQFFASLVTFAVTGFQATIGAGNSNGTMIVYCYCCCIFCELFVYCWFGNAVQEQSKTLVLSGYDSPWYDFDQSFKKSLIIFLTNAQRPLFFTAGGFMGLLLPSFAGIMSKSYSFITVLRQVYS